MSFYLWETFQGQRLGSTTYRMAQKVIFVCIFAKCCWYCYVFCIQLFEAFK